MGGGVLTRHCRCPRPRCAVLPPQGWVAEEVDRRCDALSCHPLPDPAGLGEAGVGGAGGPGGGLGSHPQQQRQHQHQQHLSSGAVEANPLQHGGDYADSDSSERGSAATTSAALPPFPPSSGTGPPPDRGAGHEQERSAHLLRMSEAYRGGDVDVIRARAESRV